MFWMKSVAAELLSLFVDDGSFAATIVLWLAAAWFVRLRVPLAPSLAAGLFVLGFVAILIESATRRARKRRAA